jgi:fibro-slime domain-containing protein
MKKSFLFFLTGALLFNLCCFEPFQVQAADGDTYTIRTTIRDFDPVNNNRPELNHPDFENPAYFNTTTERAVKPELGKDGTPVYSDSGYSQKIITSEDSFYDWYHDTDKNITISYPMVFTKSGDNYVFDSSQTGGFFPINNKGFGNYQDNKNYHFTLEMHTKFQYKSGQVFDVAGDDDLWVFINGKIVADMGGIHETQRKTIYLDNYAGSLGLESGKTYELALFFAERHVTESNLKISTNIFVSSNNPPVANAGKNQTKSTSGDTATVKLDGSSSKDPDGDSLTYIWKNSKGNTIAFGKTPEVELPVGKNIITLTVSDGELTDTDEVEILVTTTNPAAPIADAGDDKTVKTEKNTAKVTLDGSRSYDPNGDKLTYKWTDEDGDTIGTGVSPEVSLPLGRNTIKLTVSDGDETDTDQVVITVVQNRKPVANAGDDQRRDTEQEKVTITLDGSRSYDPDGDKLTYKWTDEDDTVIGKTDRPTVELPYGVNRITLTVSDGVSTDTDEVVITINRINAPTADAGKNQTKTTNGKTAFVTLDGSGSKDPNNDRLTYKWTDENGRTIATGVNPTVELSTGKHTITLTVSDGRLTDTDTVVITVEKNNPPVANAGNDQSVSTSSTKASVTLDGSKSKDPDGDTLTYKWTNENGDTIGTKAKTTVELPVGVNKIKLTVSDGIDSDSDTVVITVESTSGNQSSSGSNRAPSANAGKYQEVLTNKSSATVKLDGSKSYDKDGDSLTYTWKNESNKTIATSAKPEVTLPVGRNKLTLTVSDGKLTSSDTVIVVVGNNDIIDDSGRSADVAISLTANKQRIEENKEFTFTIKYANKNNIRIKNAYIEFELPDGISVVDKGDGKQKGNIISWDLGNLEANKKDQLKLKVKANSINKADIIKEFTATIFSEDTVLSNLHDDTSKLGIMVYSNRYDNSHKRYILGYPDGTFKGERNITRAETAVIFARILELENLKVTNKNQFHDVKNDFWAADHIYAAVQVGLFEGTDSTHFNPNVAITRAELATVIANYLKISKTDNQKPFELTFNDISYHWAKGNIEEIARYGITEGYEDGSFKPEKQITRQEAVTMINRMLYRGPLNKSTNTFPDMKSNHWAFEDVEEAVSSHEFEINNNDKENLIKLIKDSIW